MAKILCVLASGRKKGFTSQAYEAAIDGMKAMGVEVEEVWLPKYKVNHCTSCFSCVRDPENKCVQKDDMGGDGALMKKVLEADGYFIADPTYFWGGTSRCATFFERFYPTVWTGATHGKPFGVVCTASNQGFMHEGIRQYSKWAFILKCHWVDGISMHLADFENQLKQCEYLGTRIAEEALKIEAAGGRVAPGDEESVLEYQTAYWDPIEGYIYNLTQGTYDWSKSLPYKALAEGRFTKPEAIEQLKIASEQLRLMIQAWKLHDLKGCAAIFPTLASSWTSATWMEFLQDNVIGSEKPRTYRSGK